MEKEISKEIAATREGFLQAIALFTPDNFNKVPFEGSWTAGQVAEHVFKSIDGTPQLLLAEGERTERDPDLHVAQLRNLFLDFSTKMKSPARILPSGEAKEQAELKHKLDTVLDSLVETAGSVDPDLTVPGFEFPGMGPLSRLELLNFLSVHTQRHEHQLRDIATYF